MFYIIGFAIIVTIAIFAIALIDNDSDNDKNIKLFLDHFKRRR